LDKQESESDEQERSEEKRREVCPVNGRREEGREEN
jgi:hypothetical protein